MAGIGLIGNFLGELERKAVGKWEGEADTEADKRAKKSAED